MPGYVSPPQGQPRILLSDKPNPSAWRNRRRHLRLVIITVVLMVLAAAGGAGLVRILELGGAAITSSTDAP